MRLASQVVLVIAAVVAFAGSAHAERWHVSQKKRTVHVFLEKESGLYVLRAYQEKPDEMQTRILQQTYKTEKEARRSTKKYLKSLGYEEPSADLPPKAAAPVVAGSTNPRFITEVPGRSIWVAANDWSWEWEKKYSNWVRDYVDLKFFSRYNISTDCADVAVGLRWIFARMHSLPVGNMIAGSDRLFTNASMRKEFLSLPTGGQWFEDELFLAALDYVMDNTFTRSILWDGYPVRLDHKSLIPGTFHLEFHSEGGHTMIVSEVNPSQASLYLIQSTLPRAVRDMWATSYQHSSQPSRVDGGFFRMRWPVKVKNGWALLSEDQHPKYSAEQYSPSFMSGTSSFSTAVKNRLTGQVGQLDPYTDFIAGLTALWEKLEPRVQVVEDGFAFCQVNNCKPPGENWQEWSTPGRDSHILEKIKFAQDVVRDNPNDKRIQDAYRQFVEYEMTIDGQQVPIALLFENFLKGKTSGDPRVSVRKRWGL